MTLKYKEHQTIFLLRRLLITFDLICDKYDLDQRFISNNNFSLYDVLINVASKNQFEDYKIKPISKAWLTSLLFKSFDIYHICTYVNWTFKIDYKP